MKFLIFLVVAAAAVGAGVYLSKLAPTTDEDTTYVAPRTVRRQRPKVSSPGIVDTQMGSLKQSLDSLKHRQREMQDLLPPEDRDPAALAKTEAADAIFKKDKTLDDYKQIILEAVKSVGNIGKDITETK